MSGVLRKKGQKNNSKERATHPAWLDDGPAFF
jgi:hypothetical protein